MIISLAFYYRIFPVPGFRRLLIWVAGLCLLYTIGGGLATIFQWYAETTRSTFRLTFWSDPVSYLWDRIGPYASGHCLDAKGLVTGIGCTNTALNCLLFILVSYTRTKMVPIRWIAHSYDQPIPLLRRLRTTLKQQIVLGLIFTLASL